MKKIIALTFIGFTLLFISSCSHNSNVDGDVKLVNHTNINSCTSYSVIEEGTTAAFEELNQQLLLLNDIYPSEIQSRGRVWNWFKRIIIGDFLGACLGGALTWSPIGAVLMGIYGSMNGAIYEYYQENKPTSRPSRPTINPNMNSLSYQSAINSGYLHNLVIYDIFETYGDSIYNMSNATLQNTIIEHTEQYTIVPNSIKNNFTSDITNKIILDNAIQDYGTIPSELILSSIENSHPNISNELETLAIFGDHYSELTTENTRNSYTSSFINTVNTSSIPTTSKNLIISSVSTANYSTKLWVEIE